MAAAPDGILLVDKPSGPTSAEVVRTIKRRFRVASIGHLGTLDPMATGLLPLCLGRGTRIAQFLAAERKAYEGEIRLGIATDTLDVTGRVTAEAEVPHLETRDLEEAARRFVGPGEQQPPMYSAVKVGGRELYKLARAGLEVERAARPIEIFSLAVAADPGDRTRLRFAVECSKGTYVRVLVSEIGAVLGTLGTLAALRRTRFGPFSVAEAHRLDDVLGLEDPGALPVLGLRSALRGAREIPVDPAVASAVAAGRQAVLREIEPPREADHLAALVTPEGLLVAILEAASSAWRLRRVLSPPGPPSFTGHEPPVTH